MPDLWISNFKIFFLQLKCFSWDGTQFRIKADVKLVCDLRLNGFSVFVDGDDDGSYYVTLLYRADWGESAGWLQKSGWRSKEARLWACRTYRSGTKQQVICDVYCRKKATKKKKRQKILERMRVMVWLCICEVCVCARAPLECTSSC